jgi:hypothetical protein
MIHFLQNLAVFCIKNAENILKIHNIGPWVQIRRRLAERIPSIPRKKSI